MELPADIKNLYLMWLAQDIEKFSLRQHKSGMLYSKAIDSLSAHDGVVFRPSDLKKIKFFGPKIIENMTKKLAQYCKENGYIMPADEPTPSTSTSTKKRETTADSDKDAVPKRKQSTRAYVPKKGSGGYAILLVLLEHDPNQVGITKDTIANNASQYCSSSFSKNPSSMQMYSAWDTHKSLLKHELIKSQGKPAKYFLTEDGIKLAETLKKEGNIKFRDELEGTGKTYTEQSAVPATRISHNRPEHVYENVRYHFWNPESYKVVFVIDNREMRSKDQRDFFAVKLGQLGVEVTTRALSVGDGLWIARNKETNQEVVLDYIIERKRLDDLASSIKDGRYTEQKIRLKRTGISNVFYVVEEVTSSELQSMADAIRTSMSLNMTNSNFHLKRTKDADATVQFIYKMTNELSKFYSTKKLLVMDPNNLEFQEDYKKCLDLFGSKFNDQNTCAVHKYHTFQTMLSKSNLMTTREMFVRMLMTIRGISLEKASAIQKEFKTPRYLIENFDPKDQDFASKYGKRVQELIYETFQKKG